MLRIPPISACTPFAAHTQGPGERDMKRRHDAVEGLYKEQLRLYLGFPRALQGGWVNYQVRGVPQLPIAVDRLQGWGRKERRVTGGSHSGRGGRGQGQGRGRGGEGRGEVCRMFVVLHN